MSDENSAGHKSESHGQKLGLKTKYPQHYSKELLDPIPRSAARASLASKGIEPIFYGEDIWNCYELSWLNNRGKPQVALGEFRFDCSTECIVESKSFKLYLNSLNQTRFHSAADVQALLSKDLSEAVAGAVQVNILTLDQSLSISAGWQSAECIDDLDIEVIEYSPKVSLLESDKSRRHVSERLYSHLLKSNCPVTDQPDWASVYIDYEGVQISHESLLSYLISYRGHQGFHENCVERIFCDIQQQCKPEKLLVYARYTRRGGLDINPLRASYPLRAENIRLSRQ